MSGRRAGDARDSGGQSNDAKPQARPEWRNWSGAVACAPDRYYRPTTEDELRAIVARHAGERTIRVAGAGHSFSDVVPTDEVLVSLERYTGVTSVDYERRRATVRAGTPLSELNETLAVHGLAMTNLGDIDRQTIAGALATGTHGTGIDLGILSTQAVELRVVTADGEVRTLSADGGGDALGVDDGDALRAAQVSLGALGIVSEVTLDLDPAYDLRERTWTAPLDAVLDDLERLREAHRHFEFFWFPHTDTALVKTLEKTDVAGGDGPKIDGSTGVHTSRNDPPVTHASPATDASVPADASRTDSLLPDSLADRLGALDERAENLAWGTVCRLSTLVPGATPQLARFAASTLSGGETVGPSHEVFATRRDVRFNESEYGVPADDGADVVRDLRDRVLAEAPEVIYPVEFRYVAGDEIPLSPAYGRDTAFVAVHRYHRKPYRSYLSACERVFDEYDGRPHWGKWHSLGADRLRELYPEWEAFQDVRREFDPDGAFLNDHLEGLFDSG